MKIAQQELEELLVKITLYDTLEKSVINMLNGQLANAATSNTLQKERVKIQERIVEFKSQLLQQL